MYVSFSIIPGQIQIFSIVKFQPGLWSTGCQYIKVNKQPLDVKNSSIQVYIEPCCATVDSKIDENRCKQKYKLIQVMGILYRNISYTAITCSEIFTVIYLFQCKIV